MAVFAIADFHLPGHNEKPMDVFGDHWQNHFDKIRMYWQELINPKDVVLIAGDISWAMQLEKAMDDLLSIASLNGRKVLIRGNHDYWWSSLKKIRSCLPREMYVLQNDALQLDSYIISGARGWYFPTETQNLSEEDTRIYQRELIRLEMSLKEAQKLGGAQFAMMHFPPLLSEGESTPFTDLLEQYGVQYVVYGHLHGIGIASAFQGQKRGIEYHLTSCDALHFCPVKICD